MKKLFISIALTIFFVNFVILNVHSTETSFRGVVIYVDGTTIEVKRGARERLFQIGDTTAVTRNNATLSRSEIQVCQTVRVFYSSSDHRIASRVQIVSESYCVQ